jgi:hypothetical protein
MEGWRIGQISAKTECVRYSNCECKPLATTLTWNQTKNMYRNDAAHCTMHNAVTVSQAKTAGQGKVKESKNTALLCSVTITIVQNTKSFIMLNQMFFPHTNRRCSVQCYNSYHTSEWHMVTYLAQCDVTANGHAVTIKYQHFVFNKHCRSTTIRLHNTCFISNFHLDSEPMQAAHDSMVRPLQNVSTHFQGVHVLKCTRQSWTLAKWTYVMDLKISIEVNCIKSIKIYYIGSITFQQ